MQNIILSFLTSLLVVIFGIPSVITVAKQKGLFDKPDHRKLHVNKVPRLGGLAIIAGFSIAVSIWGIPTEIASRLQYLQAALIVLFFSGLKDDILVLTPIKKLMSQLLAAALVVVGEDIRITSFYGLFGVTELNIWVSYILSVFTIVVITNAFNLIDGIDGLAGGLGFIISITFGLWFNLIDQVGWSIISFSLAGALIGFLVFNFNPAKIFMGDAGSLCTGFLLSIMAVQFIEFNRPEVQNYYKITTAPVIAIAILVIPLFDTFRVFTIRLLKKKSPFSADRNHLHHMLLKTGLGHKEVSLVLYIVNIIFVLIAFLLKDSPILTVFITIGVLAFALSQIPIYINSQRIADIESDTNGVLSKEITENILSDKHLSN
jgi:UDP-N-acetylmuramyl pentapeptide phosphotransferase/UDP-N-acetylglucosamine-1-phosphate transferase